MCNPFFFLLVDSVLGSLLSAAAGVPVRRLRLLRCFAFMALLMEHEAGHLAVSVGLKFDDGRKLLDVKTCGRFGD